MREKVNDVTAATSPDENKPANNEDVKVTPTRESDIQRAIHSEWRRERQQVYARKAMKQRGKALEEKGLGPGAVLCLKVDYRTPLSCKWACCQVQRHGRGFVLLRARRHLSQ